MEAATIDLPTQPQGIEHKLSALVQASEIEIPMLPEVANKALNLVQDPKAGATEMAALIQSDQSLAGHVMRIANSVAYTPQSNLVSLQQGIARLGMAVISEIALAAVVGARLFKTPGFDDYVAHVWQHALATSLWCKEIARQCRSNVEVAFLAGLLHSIGRPAVVQTVLDLAQAENTMISELEVHAIESRHHQQLTQAVVKAWDMPKLVVEAICCGADMPAETSAGKTAAVVRASKEFANLTLNPAGYDSDALLQLESLAALNLYQDEVEHLLSRQQLIQQSLTEMAA